MIYRQNLKRRRMIGNHVSKITVITIKVLLERLRTVNAVMKCPEP